MPHKKNESITGIRVSVYIAVSLDGYIARADGDIDWLTGFSDIPAGEDFGYSKFFESVDVLVMGRGSYEKVLTFSEWPYGNKKVIVLSRSKREVPESLSDRVRILPSSPRTLLARLEEEGAGHVYLDGGRIVQDFLRAGLVNDLTITTVPLLIGEGLPLFGKVNQDIRLSLVDCQKYSNGFVQSHYRLD